jgi:hypothetical protein
VAGHKVGSSVTVGTRTDQTMCSPCGIKGVKYRRTLGRGDVLGLRRLYEGRTLARIRDKTGLPRRACLGRMIVVVAAGCVAAAAPGVMANGDEAGNKGRLVVTEKVVNRFGIYEEGAISYLKVRRRADGKVVLRRRYQGRRIRLAEELPARRYRLISFVRPCSGNCDNLDPATDRCTAKFRLRPDTKVRARTVTNDGEPCRIRFPES